MKLIIELEGTDKIHEGFITALDKILWDYFPEKYEFTLKRAKGEE